MFGMREERDSNRPLEPWRDTDCSSIYRYDTVFSFWVCLVLTVLTLECHFVACLLQLLLGCRRDVTSVPVLPCFILLGRRKPPSPCFGNRLLIEGK